MDSIQELKWDSDFFGKSVFSINTNSQKYLDFCLSEISRKSLVYVFSDIELPNFQKYLVDKKVTFDVVLNSGENYKFPGDCFTLSEFNLAEIDELERLAIIAGIYSRFRIDTQIEANKADELYRLWLKKALFQKENYDIVCVRSGSSIAGMCMIKKTQQKHQIDLVAVDDRFRRQGVGKKLMMATIANAAKFSVNQVSVITQLDNTGACKLYESSRFKISNIKYVYHIHINP